MLIASSSPGGTTSGALDQSSPASWPCRASGSAGPESTATPAGGPITPPPAARVAAEGEDEGVTGEAGELGSAGPPGPPLGRPGGPGKSSARAMHGIAAPATVSPRRAERTASRAQTNVATRLRAEPLGRTGCTKF